MHWRLKARGVCVRHLKKYSPLFGPHNPLGTAQVGIGQPDLGFGDYLFPFRPSLINISSHFLDPRLLICIPFSHWLALMTFPSSINPSNSLLFIIVHHSSSMKNMVFFLLFLLFSFSHGRDRLLHPSHFNLQLDHNLLSNQLFFFLLDNDILQILDTGGRQKTQMQYKMG